MANLPSFRRLFKQDYDQEDQNLVERLGNSLNYGIEVLYNALNNNLTFEDNFKGSVNTVSVTLNSDGTPKNRTTYSLNRSIQASGTLVISASNQTNSSVYPDGGIFISFQQVGSSEVQINHITGLPADNTFALTIITFG